MAGGNITHTEDTITYSSVVTRETVCMATLHELEIKVADMLNAYVMAPTMKRYEQY